MKGNFNKALYHYKIIEKEKLKPLSYLQLMYNSATLYFKLGDLDITFDYFTKCIEEAKSNNILIWKARSNVGISEIWRIKGDTVKSREYYEKAKEVAIIIKNKYLDSMISNTEGLIYLQENSLLKAQERFMETIRMLEELSSRIELIDPLFNVILSLIERDQVDEAEEFLLRMQDIGRELNRPDVDFKGKLAKALIQKNMRRASEKIIGQNILQELVYEKGMNNDLMVFAIINLCELLLAEFKSTSEDEVYVEFEGLLILISKLYIR